jgi:hypothetical protein
MRCPHCHELIDPLDHDPTRRRPDATPPAWWPTALAALLCLFVIATVVVFR